jgi:acyl-CoA thioesterase
MQACLKPSTVSCTSRHVWLIMARVTTGLEVPTQTSLFNSFANIRALANSSSHNGETKGVIRCQPLSHQSEAMGSDSPGRRHVWVLHAAVPQVDVRCLTLLCFNSLAIWCLCSSVNVAHRKPPAGFPDVTILQLVFSLAFVLLSFWLSFGLRGLGQTHGTGMYEKEGAGFGKP